LKDNLADLVYQVKPDQRGSTKSDARKSRGSIDICADILEICSAGGALKTHVMYRANLSYGMMAEYGKLLFECELLILGKSDSRIVFKTTEKGRQYLLHYQCMQQLTKSPARKAGF
jgi:predicted transcriptional regulator